MTTDDGGHAYPVLHPKADECVGMSFRDAAAIAALQGMLSSAPLFDRTAVNKEQWAVVAYDFADAMVAEKRKRDAP